MVQAKMNFFLPFFSFSSGSKSQKRRRITPNKIVSTEDKPVEGKKEKSAFTATLEKGDGGDFPPLMSSSRVGGGARGPLLRLDGGRPVTLTEEVKDLTKDVAGDLSATKLSCEEEALLTVTARLYAACIRGRRSVDRISMAAFPLLF